MADAGKLSNLYILMMMMRMVKLMVMVLIRIMINMMMVVTMKMTVDDVCTNMKARPAPVELLIAVLQPAKHQIWQYRNKY